MYSGSILYVVYTVTKTGRNSGCWCLIPVILATWEAVLHSWRPTQAKSLQDPSQWLMPVILAMQETEIGRIAIPDQPQQKVHETLSQQKKLGVMTHTCPSSPLQEA
jgi:hypothetical protein